MPRGLLIVAALAVVFTGCERHSPVHITGPAPAPTPTPITYPRYVQGKVVYIASPGAVVDHARVWLMGDFNNAVFSDSLGWYVIPIEYSGRESLTVTASKPTGFGAWSGGRKFVINEYGGAIVTIVLDHFSNL
jgi:hypothetical protein